MKVEVASGPAYQLHVYRTGRCRVKGEYAYARYARDRDHLFAIYVAVIQNYGLMAVVDTGMEIYFEFSSKNMGGMSADAYVDLITSAEPVDYQGLPAVDRDGIKSGTVTPGMCKDGVMVAWGYPAKHRTPSTDADLWFYWQNRMASIGVQFDADGKVANLVK